MGNHLATRRAAEPRASLDQSPHGRPNNSYWRKRRAEDTWKLREALLDGRVEAVCVWLGIDAHKHADLLGNEATTSRSRDRDPEPPRSSSGERVGCSQVCSCLYGNAESPTDDANGNAVHSLPPITANNTAASEDMATCAPRWSCLGSLDLSSHRWEDDGGHSALHYLAGGRTETSYMSTNFPVIGQDASPGSKPDHESSRHRLALMLILLREGYITRDAVIMTNGSGATPVHVAAAVGNQMFVIAMLRKRASSAPTFSASAVDTALLTADADGLVPVDAAAKFGHAGVARYLGLGLLSNIADVIARSRDTLSQSSLSSPAHLPLEHPGPAPAASGRLSSVVDRVLGSLPVNRENSRGEGLLDGQGKLVVKVCKNDDERRWDLKRKEKELAVRLGVPQREAACLLAESSFDVDQTVLVGLRRRAQLVQSADKLTAAVDILDVVKTKGDAGWSVCAEGECGGVAGGAGGRLGLGLAEQECPVCFDVVSDKDAMYKEALHGCRHFACDQCLFGHVRVRVMDEGDVSLLVCPAESCRARIPAAAVEKILAPDPAALARFSRLLSAAIVTKTDKIVWCPAAGCSASIELPPAVSCRSVAVRCSCGSHFCAGCSAMPHHEPASCAAWEMLVTELQNLDREGQRKSEQWIEATTMRCTGCRAPVERSLGCNHIECTRCGHHFCFACGDVWASEHYGCARSANPDHRLDNLSGDEERAELVRWCSGGYGFWDAQAHRLPLDHWPSLARSGIDQAASAGIPSRVAGEVGADAAGSSTGASTASRAAPPAPLSPRRLLPSWGGQVFQRAKSPRRNSSARPPQDEKDEENCGYHWVDLEQGGRMLGDAHRELVSASRIMACSFAVDLVIPHGFKFIRARRRLRQLRGALEADLRPLSQLVVCAQGDGSRLDCRHANTPKDKSLPLAMIYVISTEPDIAKALAALSARVRRQATRLVVAGQSGVLTAPSTGTETVKFLAAEVFSAGKSKAAQLVKRLSVLAEARIDGWMTYWAWGERPGANEDTIGQGNGGKHVKPASTPSASSPAAFDADATRVRQEQDGNDALAGIPVLSPHPHHAPLISSVGRGNEHGKVVETEDADMKVRDAVEDRESGSKIGSSAEKMSMKVKEDEQSQPAHQTMERAARRTSSPTARRAGEACPRTGDLPSEEATTVRGQEMYEPGRLSARSARFEAAKQEALVSPRTPRPGSLGITDVVQEGSAGFAAHSQRLTQDDATFVPCKQCGREVNCRWDECPSCLRTGPETPVALAIPVTDVFVLTIADIESFACTLSRWALTGLVDLGLSMRFTNLERKWTMASVEPEMEGLSLRDSIRFGA